MDYKKIKETAKARNIKVTELAKKAGITTAGFYKIIEQESTTVDTLEKISAAIGVPVQFWWDSEEESKKRFDFGLSEDKKQIRELEKRIALLEEMLEDKRRLLLQAESKISEIENKGKACG